jgi:hypothetical protein
VQEGLCGIECLAGIPGSSGAVPVQNVGAYGQEVAQTLVAVDAERRVGGQWHIVLQVVGPRHLSGPRARTQRRGSCPAGGRDGAICCALLRLGAGRCGPERGPRPWLYGRGMVNPSRGCSPTGRAGPSVDRLAGPMP